MSRAPDAADLLARTLFAEAGHRPVRALEAVASVAMTRARLGLPCSGPPPGDPPGACRRVAARALAGALPDPTGGATHYHDAAELPRWALGVTPTAELGGLVFYRLPA